MLRRIFLAGFTLAVAGLGWHGPAAAQRFGTYQGGFRYRAVRPIHHPSWRPAAIPYARHRAFASPAARPAAPVAPVAAVALTGRASFYSGGRTASGGIVGAATCANRWLPFGTRVLVTNLGNLRQMVLVVNDRGPFVGGRIVDVSRTAAAALGMLQSGVANVRMQVIGGPG